MRRRDALSLSHQASAPRGHVKDFATQDIFSSLPALALHQQLSAAPQLLSIWFQAQSRMGFNWLPFKCLVQQLAVLQESNGACNSTQLHVIRAADLGGPYHVLGWLLRAVWGRQIWCPANLVSRARCLSGATIKNSEHARCRLETTPLPKQPVGARYLLLGLTGRLKASGCLTRSNIQKSVGEWLGNVCEGMNSERKALRKDGA